MADSRRLLVGFDGSPNAIGALWHAARTARRNHGCLIVVSVVAESATRVAESPFGPCGPVLEDPEQRAADLLRLAAERLPEQVSVVTVVRHGRVGPVLVQEADRFACDAIVIGAHQSLRSRLTGGVEHYVRRNSRARLIVAQTPSCAVVQRVARILSGLEAGAARPAATGTSTTIANLTASTAHDAHNSSVR